VFGELVVSRPGQHDLAVHQAGLREHRGQVTVGRGGERGGGGAVRGELAQGGDGGRHHQQLALVVAVRRGLVLRSDLLGAWTRWITPEFETRRYDTWFFVAALPQGQRTRNASTEADRTVWIRPADAAASYDKGELLMMPPTIATLRRLTPFATAAQALAAAPDLDLTPVLAQARLVDGEVVLSWPGHDEFTKRIGAEATGKGPA